ncbi:MAG TPA: DHA2 family efflux MFS transporter permease subunit [Micromonosporaceae bacterium]
MSVPRPASVALSSAAGRGLLLAAVLGSGMAFLDSTVVNVALPHIGRDLNATLADLQWTVNAYTLMLAAFVLLGGALGDRYGRRTLFLTGVVWFTVASVLCGFAVSPGMLIASRTVQGIGAALLTPGSLALIQSTVRSEDRGRAIGVWSGLSGVSTAVGPFLGGWLIDAFSWRWIFFINVPLAAVVVAAGLRWVPESRDAEAAGRRFDVLGAVLGAVSLGGITYALVEAPNLGASPAVLVASAVGLLSGSAFVFRERRTAAPMLPPWLFKSRQFTAINVVTFFLYAALGVVPFFLVVELQTVAGYSALVAGVALLPLTVLMLVGSSYAGALGSKIGPRLPLTVGPLLGAAGALLLLAVGPDTNYLTDVLPAATVMGLGVTLFVAPLTASVLAAVPDHVAGIASGVSNAVARAASMLAVAALPLAVGLSGKAYADPTAFDRGYRLAMVACAGLFAVGGVLGWVLVRGGGRRPDAETRVRAQPGVGAQAPAPADVPEPPASS